MPFDRFRSLDARSRCSHRAAPHRRAVPGPAETPAEFPKTAGVLTPGWLPGQPSGAQAHDQGQATILVSFAPGWPEIEIPAFDVETPEVEPRAAEGLDMVVGYAPGWPAR